MPRQLPKIYVLLSLLLAASRAAKLKSGKGSSHSSPCATALWRAISAFPYAEQADVVTASEEWGKVLDNVLAGPYCKATLRELNTTISWLRFPGWMNGVLWKTLMDMRNDDAIALLTPDVTLKPYPVPPPSYFNFSSVMRSYASVQEGIFDVTTADLSGMTATNRWEMVKSMLGHTSAATLPENICVNSSKPYGLVHPRTYLLMYYRADTLDQLVAAGHIPSSQPPEDWEALLQLLAAHRTALASHHSATSAATADRAAASALPQHGLCVTTNSECGRLGDVFSAMAASVVQTAGTTQGVYWDLDVPPSAAVTMVNNTGWRYAAGLLARMLLYNAPDEGILSVSSDDVSALSSDSDSDTDSGPDGANGFCAAESLHFLRGDCLVTMDWDVVFNDVGARVPLNAPGARVGTAPLPGSRRVMDRRPDSPTAGQLVDCSWELCGVSGFHDLLYMGQPNTTSSRSGGSSSVASLMGAVGSAARQMHPLAASDGTIGFLGTSWRSQPCNPATRKALEEEGAMQAVAGVAGDRRLTVQGLLQRLQPALVNRAPYSAVMQAYASTNMLTLTNSTEKLQMLNVLENAVQERIIAMYSLKAGPLTAARTRLGYEVLTNNQLQYARTRWWTALDEPFAVSDYTGLNITGEAAQAYMRAVWHALHSPNAATEPSFPITLNFAKWALAHVASDLANAVNAFATAAAASTTTVFASSNNNKNNVTSLELEAMAEQMQDTLVAIFTLINEAFGPAAVRLAYADAINARWLSENNISESQPPPSGGSGLSSTALTVLLVCLISGAVIATVFLFLIARQRIRHRDLLGRVRAPRVGPDTSLLISDIQNSTRLWEELSVATMDTTLRLHHATFRRLLDQFYGYESATEGDSFIIAFPTPFSALGFASACQTALLQQDWPAELLNHPDGAVVRADPRDGGSGVTVAACAVARSGMALPGGWRPFCRLFMLYHMLRPQPQPPPQGRGPPAWEVDRTPTHNAYSQFGSAKLNPGGGGGEAFFESMSRGNTGLDDGMVSSGQIAQLPILEDPAEGTEPSTPPPLQQLHAASNGSGGGGRGANGVALLAAGVRQGSCSNANGVTIAAAGSVKEWLQGQGDAAPGGALMDDRSSITTSTTAASYKPMWWVGASSTWKKSLAAAYPLAAATAHGTSPRPPSRCPKMMSNAASQPILVFRGPRVRMGIHSGLDDPCHVVFNKVGSSFKYYGLFAETTKLVGDAAVGGLITLSSPAFARLRNGDRQATARLKTCPTLVIYAGHYQLEEPKQPQQQRPVQQPAPLPSLLPAAPALALGTAPSQAPALPGTLITAPQPPTAPPAPHLAPSATQHAQPPPPPPPPQQQQHPDAVRREAQPGGDLPKAGAVPGVSSSTHADHVTVELLPEPALGPSESRPTAGPVAEAVEGSPARAETPALAAGYPAAGNAQPQPLGAAGSGAVTSPELAVAAAATVEEEDGVAVFVAVPVTLACRLAHTGPLRAIRETQLGTLSAPTGSIAIAFMKVVGASTLLVDMPGPAAKALDHFQRLVCRLLGARGGYLVEGGDGLVLAAFGNPLAGVQWALDCVAGLQDLPWEDELLGHELCEEVVTVRGANGSLVAAANASLLRPFATTIPAVRQSLSGANGHPGITAGLSPAAQPAGPVAESLAPAAAAAAAPAGPEDQQPQPQGPLEAVSVAAAPADGADPGTKPGAAAGPGSGPALGTGPGMRSSRAFGGSAVDRTGPSLMMVAAPRRCVERGLRIKVGLDVGPVMYSLTEASGRLSYRGKVMNRAARIAGRAAAGQVLCSGAVWMACEAGLGLLEVEGEGDEEAEGGLEGSEGARGSGPPLLGVSLGRVSLKGISSPVELVQCVREA